MTEAYIAMGQTTENVAALRGVTREEQDAFAALINALADTGGRYALETMCVGGGQGMAMVLERV